MTLTLAHEQDKGLQRCRPKMKFKSHISCFQEYRRVWKNELTHPQVGSHGLPFWDLESRWTSKILESNFKGQNSLNWKVHYTIGKILKHKCLKWAHMTHLSNQNTSYGPKKNQESKCQFDFRPLKVGNCPNLLTCKWRDTHH
jgi:hypothetical protein